MGLQEQVMFRLTKLPIFIYCWFCSDFSIQQNTSVSVVKLARCSFSKGPSREAHKGLFFSSLLYFSFYIMGNGNVWMKWAKKCQGSIVMTFSLSGNELLKKKQTNKQTISLSEEKWEDQDSVLPTLICAVPPNHDFVMPLLILYTLELSIHQLQVLRLNQSCSNPTCLF